MNRPRSSRRMTKSAHDAVSPKRFRLNIDLQTGTLARSRGCRRRPRGCFLKYVCFSARTTTTFTTSVVRPSISIDFPRTTRSVSTSPFAPRKRKRKTQSRWLMQIELKIRPLCSAPTRRGVGGGWGRVNTLTVGGGQPECKRGYETFTTGEWAVWRPRRVRAARGVGARAETSNEVRRRRRRQT